jgi:hypothetical protein
MDEAMGGPIPVAEARSSGTPMRSAEQWERIFLYFEYKRSFLFLSKALLAFSQLWKKCF